MKKYRVVSFSNEDNNIEAETQDFMNHMAESGWEVVSTSFDSARERLIVTFETEV